MDETLTRAVVDISGRPFLYFDGQFSGSTLLSKKQTGDITENSVTENSMYEFQVDTIEDFWQGFTNAAGCNLHLEILRGRSDHHKIEALFKAAAKALRFACEIDERACNSIPSTKGIIV